MKARGEMVPEVHCIDEELEPHITLEQHYVSKGGTAKGAKPKSTIKTPVKDSPHKEGLKTKIDPVRITQSKDNTEIDSKSPRPHPRIPYSSPRTSLIQPKSFSTGTQQKGYINLKFTR